MDRAAKLKRMQEVVDRYPDVQSGVTEPVTMAKAAAPATESVWDTMKRMKSNAVDKPLENLRMNQNLQARKWKAYRDELQTILKQ